MKKGNIVMLLIALTLLVSCGANTNRTTYEAKNTVDTTTPVTEAENIDTNYEETIVETNSDDLDLSKGIITTEEFTSDSGSEDISVSISTNSLVFRDEDLLTDTLLVNGNEVGGFETEIGLNIEFVKIEGTNVEFIVDSSKGISNYVYDVSTGTNTATLVSQ